MANTYTWNFPQIDTAQTEGDLSDVAKSIHWRLIATHQTAINDEGAPLSVSAYGSVGAGEANADNFTAFDSLTKDWCKKKVLASLSKTEAQVQAMLDEQLQNLITPPIVAKTPSSW
tara:strand:- start:203 stop:550 length:348 start_codon:yes stop_codon:yes gene_type:complete